MLCNRSLNPILTGSIFFDGKAVNSKFFRRNVAFVSQDDNLFSYLTVYETLLLSAHFSFPVNTSKYELLSAVDSTLSQLGLSKVKNTIIGSSTRRGVSGGEKKRVAIAKEVLSNPSIIFMDEPTSGLDSYQAQSVIRSFQTMANQGKIIITVIHQPRSSIFSMFHNILLLAEGSVIYFGPTEACVSYFSRLGHVCPTMYNPADYILDLVSTDSSSVDTKTASKSRVDALVLEWKTQHANDPTNYYSQDIEIENKIDDDDENQLECADSDTDEVKERDYATDHFNSYFSGSSQLSSYLLMNNHSDFRNQRSQCRHILLSISTGIKDFQVLTWRSSCQLYRNYFSVSIKLVTLIFFAAILSLIYRRMGHTQNSIQDRIGILFFITSNQVSRTPIDYLLVKLLFDLYVVIWTINRSH
jgi:ABC-type multidrug transport system ATPase subunit